MISTKNDGVSMRRLDRRPIDLPPEAILACSVVRDEVRRVPAMLEHHRAIGVDLFFIVDNGSRDGTVEFLLEQPDVRLWSASGSFREANYGARWFESLLSSHGLGHWVVIVDADELFWFDGCEDRTVRSLCDELENDGHRAVHAVLLDMYPSGPLSSSVPGVSGSPIESSPWFDRQWCHSVGIDSGPFGTQAGVFGGVRRRLFGGRVWDYCLSKVPLLRFGSDVELVGGQHWSRLAASPERAAVLHFKLDADLVDLAWRELARGERVTHQREYLSYAETLAMHPDLSAFDPSISVRFSGSAQLRDLGIVGPIDDLAAIRTRVMALMGQAEQRIEQGRTESSLALLRRASEVNPHGVAPLLRIAGVARRSGDLVGAQHALAEAIDRRPDDLELMALSIEMADTRPWWDDRVVEAARDCGVLAMTSMDPFVATEELGGLRPVIEVPWVGFVAFGTRGFPHLPPYDRSSLPALWRSPHFLKSLESCTALFTFSTESARWMAERTSIPVHMLPPPIDVHPLTFDLDKFSRSSETTVVQPGWWMTRIMSIADLPVVGEGGHPIRKVRCAPVGRGGVSTAIGREQRHHDGTMGDLVRLRGTSDLGELGDDRISDLMTGSVVLADLLDATADPVVLACLAMATPILVPPLPALVELLGPRYPLFFSSLDIAAELASDRDAVSEAHRMMIERRASFSIDRFVRGVSERLTDGATS